MFSSPPVFMTFVNLRETFFQEPGPGFIVFTSVHKGKQVYCTIYFQFFFLKIINYLFRASPKIELYGLVKKSFANVTKKIINLNIMKKT